MYKLTKCIRYFNVKLLSTKERSLAYNISAQIGNLPDTISTCASLSVVRKNLMLQDPVTVLIMKIVLSNQG